MGDVEWGLEQTADKPAASWFEQNWRHFSIVPCRTSRLRALTQVWAYGALVAYTVGGGPRLFDEFLLVASTLAEVSFGARVK
jgi:hypothetical protein